MQIGQKVTMKDGRKGEVTYFTSNYIKIDTGETHPILVKHDYIEKNTLHTQVDNKVAQIALKSEKAFEWFFSDAGAAELQRIGLKLLSWAVVAAACYGTFKLLMYLF